MSVIRPFYDRNDMLRLESRIEEELIMSENYPDGELDEDEMCECSEEPGVPCPNVATRIVEEPWTPGCFKLRVCEPCAEDKSGLGYHDRGSIRGRGDERGHR